MKNKKGFVTVYLCLFFLSLVSVICLIIGSVKTNTIQSQASALSYLWGQSILAEYDLNLKQRYGLFGYYGYPSMVKDKLSFYGEETFGPAQGGASSVDWEITACSLYDYGLRHVEQFREQVISAGKMSLIENADEKAPFMTDIIAVKDDKPCADEKLFQQLPSEGCTSGLRLSAITELLNDCTSLQNIVKKGSNQYAEHAYMFSHFRHKLDQKDCGESHLQQEIEYIICGKQTDWENENGIERRIIAMREILNLMYLNQQPKARNEALAIAEILTPGPAAVATQQTLLSMWALTESVNDYRLLIHGHQIPLIKTETFWATDLESVINNETEGYIYTGVDEGEDYEAYLGFLTYTVDESLRLLRMMDVIQINMRKFYYADFLLSDYYGGLRFTMRAYGKAEEVELCYEKKQ